MGVEYKSDCVYGWFLTAESADDLKPFTEFLVKNNYLSSDVLGEFEDEDAEIFDITDKIVLKRLEGDRVFDFVITGDYYSSDFIMLVGIELNSKSLEDFNESLKKSEEEFKLLKEFFNEEPRFISDYSIF